MSEKVKIVSIERSEFFQNPKAESHPPHIQYCSYCIHDFPDRPSCCHSCKTTAKTSDGKIFDSFARAGRYCIEKNSKG